MPDSDYRIEIDLFLDGCYGHFGDDEGYEGKHPYRVYEIADGEKVPLDAHYEAYWKNGHPPNHFKPPKLPPELPHFPSEWQQMALEAFGVKNI